VTDSEAVQSQDGTIDMVVPESLSGERVDRAVAMLSGVPRSVAAEMVEGGAVAVDGVEARRGSRPLVAGQRLQASVPAARVPRLVPDDTVAFTVLYEDPHLLVIDKPAGLVVHHGAGHRSRTLVDGLVARYPDIAELAASGTGDPTRPGIVHRLDKGTSGLVVVARTAAAHGFLASQFKEHSAGRTYRAVVAGIVTEDAGVVDAPIGRSTRRPTRMAVRASGRGARTRFEVLDRYSSGVDASLLEVTLDTGRTHQVRVHLAAIGHPVIGDDRYAGAAPRPVAVKEALAPGRLFLHACRLSLDHPEGGDRRTWESPLPADLEAVIGRLRP
jgi:23S rRNA pseudouridine1911/1915/1917 synthase